MCEGFSRLLFSLLVSLRVVIQNSKVEPLVVTVENMPETLPPSCSLLLVQQRLQFTVDC